MHMSLFVVQDGFSRRSCPNPALAFQARAGFRIIERCINMSLLVQ